MPFSTLVTTEALNNNIGGWRVFDCRHDLLVPSDGERKYRQSHIETASFAHLDRDLSRRVSRHCGRHPLPPLEEFVSWVNIHGIKPADQIVCYDDSSGMIAARLWWMFRWIGHEAVALLDGGFRKWTAEDRPIVSEIPTFERSQYPKTDSLVAITEAVEIEAQAGSVLLIDARSPERFRGDREPIDPIAGHIPGAANWPCTNNVGTDGLFKDAETLRASFLRLLGDYSAGDVVCYCGSGVSACHNLLALEVAGLQGAYLYPGSWSEWIVQPSRSISLG